MGQDPFGRVGRPPLMVVVFSFAIFGQYLLADKLVHAIICLASISFDPLLVEGLGMCYLIRNRLLATST